MTEEPEEVLPTWSLSLETARLFSAKQTILFSVFPGRSICSAALERLGRLGGH